MIIFLDFDGVLCTARQAIATNERGVIAGLDPVALMFLDRMCREYGCQVVISSSWRHNGHGTRSRRHFYELFASAGFYCLAKAIHGNWETPVSQKNDNCRGREIEMWLLENDPDADYVILDDDDRLLEYQRIRHVHTDSQNGMLMQHYVAAEKIISDAI
jgi:hypothetical protein